MNKKTSLLLIILILVSIFTQNVNALTFSPQTDISSEAAYLVDLNTSNVVYEKNPDKKLYPASLTKIITTLVCLEEISDLENTFVTAPKEIFNDFEGIDISNAGIFIGEKVNMKDLLYATMLPSACEAASMVAYGVSNGNIPNFVEKMNALTKKIGATNTNFTNPHGLFNENQYTTSKDMALITQYAIKNEQFVQIATAQSHTMQKTNMHSTERIIHHSNYMLNKNKPEYYYEYAKGIKTGTLDEAGRCLVTIAEKDGYKYLLVTLKAPYYNSNGGFEMMNITDQKTVYEWAFNKLGYKNITSKGDVIGSVDVNFSSDGKKVNVLSNDEFSPLLLQDYDLSQIEKQVALPNILYAPIKAGDKIGEIKYIDTKTGEAIFSSALVAEKDLSFSFFEKLKSSISQITSTWWFNNIFIFLIIFFTLYLLLKIYRKIRRRVLRTRKNSRRRIYDRK